MHSLHSALIILQLIYVVIFISILFLFIVELFSLCGYTTWYSTPLTYSSVVSSFIKLLQEHSYTSLCKDIHLIFSWINTKE